METGISRNQIDDAMQRFLSRGGSIKKIDPVSYTHLTLPTIYSV